MDSPFVPFVFCPLLDDCRICDSGSSTSSKDKMAGTCKENVRGSDAKEDDGRKTVYRTK
jgi:hypothetical protein